MPRAVAHTVSRSSSCHVALGLWGLGDGAGRVCAGRAACPTPGQHHPVRTYRPHPPSCSASCVRRREAQQQQKQSHISQFQRLPPRCLRQVCRERQAQRQRYSGRRIFSKTVKSSMDGLGAGCRRWNRRCKRFFGRNLSMDSHGIFFLSVNRAETVLAASIAPSRSGIVEGTAESGHHSR